MPSRIELFCFPYAGASADIFLRWRRSLPSWIEVRSVELGGRGRRLRETPATTMEELVADLLPRFELQRDRFALFGHSMGALIAYELCVALQARGAALPELLFVSSAAAPALRGRTTSFGVDMSDLSDAALRTALRRMGATSEIALGDAGLMEIVLPVLRADFRVCGSYRPSVAPPLACPIHAVGGHADTVSASELEGWRLHAARGFRADLLPGDHFYLRGAEPQLLQLIAGRLAAVPSPRSTVEAAP